MKQDWAWKKLSTKGRNMKKRSLAVPEMRLPNQMKRCCLRERGGGAREGGREGEREKERGKERGERKRVRKYFHRINKNKKQKTKIFNTFLKQKKKKKFHLFDISNTLS